MRTAPSRFQLRFRHLLDGARSLVFPCDAIGRVELDTMSRRRLNEYLFARACIGRQYARPFVESAC